jgi:hypothetical protein
MCEKNPRYLKHLFAFFCRLWYDSTEEWQQSEMREKLEHRQEGKWI